MKMLGITGTALRTSKLKVEIGGDKNDKYEDQRRSLNQGAMMR